MWAGLSHYHFLPLHSVPEFMTWPFGPGKAVCLGKRGDLGTLWVGGQALGELGVGPSSLRTISVWLQPSTQAPDHSAPSVSVARFASLSPILFPDAGLD